MRVYGDARMKARKIFNNGGLSLNTQVNNLSAYENYIGEAKMTIHNFRRDEFVLRSTTFMQSIIGCINSIFGTVVIKSPADVAYKCGLSMSIEQDVFRLVKELDIEYPMSLLKHPFTAVIHGLQYIRVAAKVVGNVTI